jgi:hypothetical protein
MADRDPILAAVDLLAPAFTDAGLDELEVEVGDLRVRLARPPAVVAEPATAPASAPASPPPANDGLTPFGEPASGMRRRHRAPAPTSPRVTRSTAARSSV